MQWVFFVRLVKRVRGIKDYWGEFTNFIRFCVQATRRTMTTWGLFIFETPCSGLTMDIIRHVMFISVSQGTNPASMVSRDSFPRSPSLLRRIKEIINYSGMCLVIKFINPPRLLIPNRFDFRRDAIGQFSSILRVVGSVVSLSCEQFPSPARPARPICNCYQGFTERSISQGKYYVSYTYF